ncbi:uncharacterized protein LOC129961586 isoform X3 [Argiope bruennichi]|uniref:uncharacterized protein LOC129961586 isoform X3 n=1 Tax=Argiope bruennichi TaxID=94029 RepID=UPI002493D584|nr:uncharacterized protein LOC129961586 isoform X3 [Argiope bruennichi]
MTTTIEIELMKHDKMEEKFAGNTSEATPHHIDSPPLMVSQPSPQEEQRVTSSSDRLPYVVACSPHQQRLQHFTLNLNPKINQNQIYNLSLRLVEY